MVDREVRTILRCEHLSRSFGATKAIDDCSLEVQEGTITSIIGPNGAGKTTLFNLIGGFLRPDSGEIYFRDRDVTVLCRGCKCHVLAKIGIAQSFQAPRGFGEMTIMESLMVPPPLANDNTLFSTLKLLISKKDTSCEVREKRALDMLSGIGLEGKRNDRLLDQDAGTQKLVELAQILLLDPSLFLLDEPLAGVSRNKVPLILNYIKGLRDKGKTIVMIEHKMEPVLNISDVIHVLVNGKVLASGSPEEIREDQRVKEAYLGVSHAGT
jgi:ABC-type branched-subunit amino acid transport system ATPase component